MESISAGEARTLEGLSLETGIPVARLRETLDEMRRQGRLTIPAAAWAAFVVLAGVGVWAAMRTPPDAIPATEPAPVAVQPVENKGDLSGLVSLASVTYGPDAGSFQVDAGFQASLSLPDGLSVSATTGGVLWGTGDHRAAVLDHVLTAPQAAALRTDVEEILRYARREAARRKLPFAPNAAVPSFAFDLNSAMYYGSGNGHVILPAPGAGSDAAAEAAITKAAKALVGEVQRLLRMQDESHRMMGP